MSQRKYLIVFSLVIGLAAAVTSYFYMGEMKRQRTTVSAPDVENRSWVVAREDISPYTVLTADMLATKTVPSALLPQDAITETRSAVGRVAIARIVKGQFLMMPHISEKRTGSDIGFIIPENYRAITVETGVATGVGNLLQPGDRVDVIVHLDDNAAASDASFILVNGLQVLATDQKIAGREESEPARKNDGLSSPGVKDQKKYSSVTLAATLEECVKINLAESIGDIQLVLHGIAQKSNPQTQVVALPDDLSPGYNIRRKRQARPEKTSPDEVPPSDFAPIPGTLPAFSVSAENNASTLIATTSQVTTGRTVYVVRGTELSSVSVKPALRGIDSAIEKSELP